MVKEGEKKTESAVTESVNNGEAIFEVDYLSTNAYSDMKDNILTKDEREVMTSAKSGGDNELPEETIKDTNKKKDSVREDELEVINDFKDISMSKINVEEISLEKNLSSTNAESEEIDTIDLDPGVLKIGGKDG